MNNDRPTVALIHASSASVAPAQAAFADDSRTPSCGTCSTTGWSSTPIVPAGSPRHCTTG